MNQGNRSSAAMARISVLLYRVALESVDGMASGRFHQQVKYPAAVVVLVCAALEAGINEMLETYLLLEQNPNRQKQIKELRAEQDIREKWIRAPEVVVPGSQPLSKTDEPYRSFDVLIKLRNAIAHYDAGFRAPSEYPDRVSIGEYKRRFTLSYEGQADWTEQLLNLECARWVCKTAQGMVHAFHRHSKSFQYLDWPDPA